MTSGLYYFRFVFSSGSFDIIRDSRRWLIIAGQENKAFAAQKYTFLQNTTYQRKQVMRCNIFSRILHYLFVVDTEKLNFQKCCIDFDLRKEWLMHFQK